MSWELVEMGSFLKVRTERFKPEDRAISGLKRIEKINFSGNIFISEKPSKTDMIIIKKGDLVISGINVAKGAMDVYQESDDITATIHYSSYKFDENKIDITFLINFLKSQEFSEALKEQVPGGIKTEIKPKHILPLKVFIPKDLNEQRKIVEKLEDKDEKIGYLSTELTDQLDLVKKLRQAYLREAIQGKLTEKWRAENPNVEKASKLLAKIKAKKEQLIKMKKLKRGKSTGQSISTIDDIEIPKIWVCCKSDDIFFITKLAGFEYTEHITLLKSGEIPVVRAQNVRPYKLNKTNLLYIDRKTSEYLERCALIKNCLLVTFIGAGIGDVALFNETERWHLALR
jgi:type I restriction enzyme S subunit